MSFLVTKLCTRIAFGLHEFLGQFVMYVDHVLLSEILPQSETFVGSLCRRIVLSMRFCPKATPIVVANVYAAGGSSVHDIGLVSMDTPFGLRNPPLKWDPPPLKWDPHLPLE